MGICQGLSWQLDGIDDDALSSAEEDEEDDDEALMGSGMGGGPGSDGGGATQAGVELERTKEEIKQTNTMSTNLTIINTNARSLCPKITSLIDCLDEMQGTVAIITETWLADGEPLEADTADLAHGAGLGLIHKNRAPNSRGVAHGGSGCDL